MADRHTAELVCDALSTAVACRGRRRMDGVIMHTGRGAEYTSTAFAQACRRLGHGGRWAAPAHAWTAVAESFFATLKVELIDRHHFRTRAEARTAIFRWIAWYNQRRLHSANDYLPPVEWEHRHANQRLDAIIDGRIATVSSPTGEVHAADLRAV